MKFRFRILTILTVVLLLSTGSANAYVRYQHDGHAVAWNGSQIGMTFDGRVMPLGSNPNRYAQQAMWTWNEVKGSNLTFLYNVATAVDVPRRDNINGIGFGRLGTGVVAQTTDTFSGSRIVEADVTFGTAWTWAYSIFAVCGDTSFDFTMVAIHELGHAFGLDHENDTPCAMNYATSVDEGGPSLGMLRINVPNADDALGARAVYPISEPGVLELSAGNHIVVDGGTTLITVPSTARTGQTIEQQFNVQNRGLGIGIAKVVFYLSTNLLIGSDDIQLAVLPKIFLPGRTIVGTAELTIPTDIAPGTYFLGYAVETSQTEGFTSDNSTAFCQPTIRILDATPPALSVNAPHKGSTVGGGPIEIRWNARDNDRVSRVTVAASLDGTSWTTLADGPKASGAVSWDPGVGVLSTHARVRVTARDPAGNEDVDDNGEFTFDRVGPTLATYFTTDQYLHKYFDLVLFGEEELHPDPTATLQAGAGAPARLEVRRAEKSQFRASIDLRYGETYTLSIVGNDRVGNETRLERRLRAGTVAAGGSQSLNLGPVALRSRGSSGSSIRETTILLAETPINADHVVTRDGRDITPEGTGVEVVAGSLSDAPLEIAWHVEGEKSRSRELSPVILFVEPDGTASVVSSATMSDDGSVRGVVRAAGVYRLGWTNAGHAGDALATELGPNHPNPFNPQTTIEFALANAGHVQLAVFDVAGRAVRTLTNDSYQPGSYRLNWDGRDDRGQSVASGVYFYRLSTQGYVQTRKMTLLK